MEQQAEPYAGVAVPVHEAAPVAPVPYTGAEPVSPAQVVAQESLPLPIGQALIGARSGSVMRIQLADGRILEVAVPPGTPPGHQIHFPVAAAPPTQLAPAPQPPMARAGVPAMPPPPPVAYAPETVTVQVPPGSAPGAVFRIKLTDGRDLDVTVPAGVQPGCTLTIAVPPRPVDRDGRPLGRSRRETDPLSECLYFLICCPLAIICCRPELLRFVSEH